MVLEMGKPGEKMVRLITDDRDKNSREEGKADTQVEMEF